MGALYVERHDAASSRARDVKWRPSGRSPDDTLNVGQRLLLAPWTKVLHTTPIFLSTVAILLFALGFNSLLVTSFSSARTTPSLHRIPIAVPPFSTALTAYSTCVLVSNGDSHIVQTACAPGSYDHQARRRNC